MLRQKLLEQFERMSTRSWILPQFRNIWVVFEFFGIQLANIQPLTDIIKPIQKIIIIKPRNHEKYVFPNTVDTYFKQNEEIKITPTEIKETKEKRENVT